VQPPGVYYICLLVAPRLRRAAAWLAPTIALAALTTAIAAVRESAAAVDGALAVATGAGFAVAIGWPVAAALALIGRALTAAWRPRALIAALTDAGGGAPRLVGWIVALIAGAALVAAATNQGVWLFAKATAFKPRTMAVLGPIVMVVVVAAVVLATRAIAVAAAWPAARLEARWARRRGGPLFTPLRVAIAVTALVTAAAWLAWRLAVRPMFGHVDTAELEVLAFVAAALIAGHLAWPGASAGRLRRARTVAAVAGVAVATVLVGVALWARAARPTLVLAVWGEGGLGADAIDFIYDLYRLRDDVPATDLVPTRRPGAPQRDVLLVTIDTVRPDRTQAYGGPAATPALVELTRRGTVFDWAFAPSNVTRRSVPALATGLVPPRIHGRVAGWALRMDPRHVTLAERLRAGGYHTIGLFCCEGFWARKRRLGLERGFTDLVIEHDGQALVEAYRERMRAVRPGDPPTFTWIHFIELHEWAGGNPALTPELRRRYDEILTQVDGFVGDLVAATADRPPERQPVVIVTGDHAEALGDHGQPFHSADLYNSQIRVPLIVAGPGIVAARVGEAAAVVDVAPTILDLAGFLPPGLPVMDGRSLADLLTGQRVADPARGTAYATMMIDRFVRERRAALVHGTWKLIEQGGRFELYDLRTDPGELRDLAGSQPARLDEMKARLRERQALDRLSPFR